MLEQSRSMLKKKWALPCCRHLLQIITWKHSQEQTLIFCASFAKYKMIEAGKTTKQTDNSQFVFSEIPQIVFKVC